MILEKLSVDIGLTRPLGDLSRGAPVKGEINDVRKDYSTAV